MRGRLVIPAMLALLATACGSGSATQLTSPTDGPPFIDSPTSIRAQAGLRDSQGNLVGTASFIEVRQGVRVDVRVSGLPPGVHGIHIHAAGKCDAPDFTTAGGHFNPDNKKHGTGPEGPHAGDLPNLEVAQNGTANYTAFNTLLSMAPGASRSILGTGGTAIVIHASADDDKTDPAGNSGARIACGVIVKLPG